MFGGKIFMELPMNSFLNRINKQKLPISYLLITLIFIFFGIFTTKGLYGLGNITREIYEHPLVVSNASLEVTKMHRSLNDAALANSSAEMEFSLNAVTQSEQNVYQQLDIIRENILGEEGRTLEKQTRQLFDDWKPRRENVVRLLKSGNKKEAIAVIKENGAAYIDKHELGMLALTLYARKKADGFIAHAIIMQSELEKITLFLSIGGVFISLIIAFTAVRLVANAEKVILEASKQLNEMALQDGLTKIANRRNFDKKLQEEWRRMMRRKEPLSLIFFDVDHFKLYNDNYGHQAGDVCLQTIANTAAQLFKRPGDLFARYGGEEFIAILTNTNLEGATTLAEELRRNVYEAEIDHDTSPVCKFVTISCGVSSVIPDESKSDQVLLKIADEALYEAKEQGRNKIVSRNIN
ncbi:MAG: diguanylate cyclase (GGDEF)-like protein [Psychromonas sp.]